MLSVTSAILFVAVLPGSLPAEGAFNPTVVVNSPTDISGSYPARSNVSGPSLTPAGITGDVVLAEDSVAPLSDACTDLSNAAAVSGRIALVDRGVCSFRDKILNAQEAGAIAVIVVNTDTPLIQIQALGVVIPSVMISFEDGNVIKSQLSNGVNVNVTLVHGSFFESFAAAAQIKVRPSSNDDWLAVEALFRLGPDSDGIDPLNEVVTLEIGTADAGPVRVIIPPGSFASNRFGGFVFKGQIGVVHVAAVIQPLRNGRFGFAASALGIELGEIGNPVSITLMIGDDEGTTEVVAHFIEHDGDD